MEYEGKLYGKIGGEYFPMIETTEDINRYKQKIKELEEQVSNTDLLHDVRLSFTSVDKAVNDLNLNKKVKWFVWNGELVRKGSICPEPVIVNGTPVLINEA